MFLSLSWENNKWTFMVMLSHFVSRIFSQHISEKQTLHSDFFFLSCNWNIVKMYFFPLTQCTDKKAAYWHTWEQQQQQVDDRFGCQSCPTAIWSDFVHPRDTRGKRITDGGQCCLSSVWHVLLKKNITITCQFFVYFLFWQMACRGRHCSRFLMPALRR